MTVTEAQRDLRRAYTGGGPGALVSALVWFAAAAAVREGDVARGFAVLFAGGVLIFPLALVVERVVFRRGPAAPGNSLGMVALEATIAMLGGLFAAWLFVPVRPELVFPLAAIAVGTHYLPFRTAYGDRTYWALGAAVAGAGFAGAYGVVASAFVLALVVGAVELVFGAVLTAKAVREG